MRFWVILLLVLVFTGAALFLAEFIGLGLFGPDGRSLVKNGSFEGENADSTEDEPFIGGLNVKVLCDGSTTIDSWVASGGLNLNRTCSGGRTPDAIGWIVNSKECPPQVPPCPDTLGIAAQDGAGLVDLTGNAGRVPDRYGSVSQAVGTEVGKRYEVSFFIGSSSGVIATQGGAVFVEIEESPSPTTPFLHLPLRRGPTGQTRKIDPASSSRRSIRARP
jgi:hypothetical protein